MEVGRKGRWRGGIVSSRNEPHRIEEAEREDGVRRWYLPGMSHSMWEEMKVWTVWEDGIFQA